MGRRSRIRSDYRKKYYPKYDIEFSVPLNSRTANQTNYCIDLDKLIKSMDVIIENESKKQIAEGGRASKRSVIEKKEKLQIWKDIRAKRILEFTNISCIAKIENAKLLETKDIIVGQFKQFDKDILEPNVAENKTLLIIGGIVLLSGFLIIIKVTTKK